MKQRRCVFTGCTKPGEGYVALPDKLVEITGKTHGYVCFDHGMKLEDKKSKSMRKQ